MIELLVLSFVFLNCGISVAGFAPVTLVAILASASFFAVVERIAAKRSGEFLGEAGVRFRCVLSGFLGAMVALLSVDGHAPSASGSKIALTSLPTTILPVLAASAVFGSLLAFTFLLPTLVARVATTSLRFDSQPDKATLRTASLLSVTILSFLFWADICDGLIALVGARF